MTTPRAPLLYLVIALGSLLGALCRWLLSTPQIDPVAGALPWSTWFVNVSGSFLIGLYATLTAPDGRWPAGVYARQFMISGVLGGYTTFSIFSLETFALLQGGRVDLAALTVILSVAGWLLAVAAGFSLGERLNRYA
jgi:fluoride exporter